MCLKPVIWKKDNQMVQRQSKIHKKKQKTKSVNCIKYSPEFCDVKI